MRNVLSLSISAGCLIVSASVAHGQSPYTTPPQQPPQPYAATAIPSYAPTPYRAVPPVPPAAYQEKSKVDHLGEAARHLEAAGLNDEAADIRQRIEVARTKQRIAQQQKKRAAKKALLAHKLAELKALSAEVDRLRQTAEGPQQVMIDIKFFEFSPTKWRALGIDFDLVGTKSDHACVACGYDCRCEDNCQCDGSAGNGLTIKVFKERQVILEFLEVARKHGLVTLLADPSIVTVSGRPASFREGGEVPVKIQTENGLSHILPLRTGTSVDFEPVVLDSGAIRFKMKATVREIAGTNEDGRPRVSVAGVNTSAELNPGQTLMLRGLVRGKLAKCDTAASCPVDECQGKSELVVLATPTLVTSTPPTMVAPAPPKIAPHPYPSATAPSYNATKGDYSPGKIK